MKYLLPLLLLCLLFGAFVYVNKKKNKTVLNVVSQQHTEAPPLVVETSVAVKTSEEADIFVDIGGAVNKPGIYRIKETSRITDILKLAGGFSSQVDHRFVSKKLNLAEKLEDSEKIYIPTIEDTKQDIALGSVQDNCTVSASAVAQKTVNSSKVNINTASKTVLLGLPGIGEAYVAKIVSGRPYKNLDDFYTRVKFSVNAKKLLEPILVYK